MSRGPTKISLTSPAASAPLTAEVDLVITSKRLRTAIATLKLAETGRFLEIVQSSKSLETFDQQLSLGRLQAFLRKHLSGETAQTRAGCIEFLSRACPASAINGFQLQRSQSLFAIREALRERVPTLLISTEESQGGHVDTLVAIDPQTFYLRGWYRDREATLHSMIALSPEGERIRIDPAVFWHARSDIQSFYAGAPSSSRCGFLCTFKTKELSLLSEGWIIELRNSAGVTMEMKAPPAIRESAAARKQILSDLLFVPVDDDQALHRHLSPAIETIQSWTTRQAAIARAVQFGTAPTSPEVSMIVPLYKRLDYLEHQLAQFALDREMWQAQLIYVLDSPEDADDLIQKAAQLHALFRLPFLILITNLNVGFALANNLAASQALGKKLLLLNSDVLPSTPGWLSQLVRFYEQTPRIGALGPKLRYEDNSLQHAGMYFAKYNGSLTWENMHYFKGLHHTLPAANIARRVPAVTGACLMVDRHLFEKVGGLSSAYVQGDYEDSDLCLRLTQEGLENWYLPTVELYHLEGGSYPDESRRLTTRYNRWLHTQRWNRQISELMSKLD